MLIRPVNQTDLADLVDLCAEHAAFEKAAYDRAGKQERLGAAIFADTPRLFVWVVVAQDSLVGYASVTLDFSTWDAFPFAHLDCLYLQPSWRSKGLGAKLLQTVIDFAKSKNCHNLQWQTPIWNKDAQRFYARLGAVQSSKERFILSLVDAE